MRIALIGTGHIGFVNAVTLAHAGYVVATSTSTRRSSRPPRGEAPFYEPAIKSCSTNAVSAGRLSFEHEATSVLPGSEMMFICVCTPVNPIGEANLAAVGRAVADIARHADDGAVVVGSPPCRRARPHAYARRSGATARRRRSIWSRTGSSCARARRSPAGSGRTGCWSEPTTRTGSTLCAASAPTLERGVRLIETDVVAAELAKRASNAFLALKISYANALARLASVSGRTWSP